MLKYEYTYMVHDRVRVARKFGTVRQEKGNPRHVEEGMLEELCKEKREIRSLTMRMSTPPL